MKSLLTRLERLEGAGVQRFPWQRVCSYCNAAGLDTTPHEHCEAGRCEAGKRAWADHIAAHPDLPDRLLEIWDTSQAMAGNDPAAELAKIEAEDRVKREAWDAKKRAALCERS
jgi:hypothetical protein